MHYKIWHHMETLEVMYETILKNFLCNWFLEKRALSKVCCCLVTKSCPALCDPMDCSLPGSSVYGISQAIILDWVAISFSRGSSPPRDRARMSCIDRWVLQPPAKPCGFHMGPLPVGPCLPGREEQVTLETPREVGIYLWSNFWFQEKGAVAFS